MRRVQEAITAAHDRKRHALRGAVHYIWDRSTAHAGAMEALGLEGRVTITPTASFEFNVVVEHAFNIVKSKFSHELLTSHNIDTIEKACEYLEDMVPQWVTQEGVLADAKLMKTRMRQIIDCGGERIF